MRVGTFGPASEEPYRRRVTDVLRLVVAAAVIVWCAVRGEVIGGAERSVFKYLNSLPNGLRPLFRDVYRVGGFFAIGLVCAAALFGRRWRLVRDLALAGIGSFAVAIVLHHRIGEPVDAAARFHLISRWPRSPSFPTLRIATALGIFATAAPYLARPTRRVLVVIALAMSVAAMYLGAAYPADVVGAAAVGWGIAALIHLIFRSPGGRPTALQVTESLAEMGIDVEQVRLNPYQQAGFTRMLGHDAYGPLWIKVIGRDEVDAQFLARLWQSVVYKDVAPRVSWTRVADIEHEAYLTLLARDNGVRVPKVLVAGRGGPGAALLVERAIDGNALEDLAPDAITDELLDAIWRDVERLRAAHIVHGRLNSAHVRVDDDGPAIVRFDRAILSGSDALASRDVAELLASTSILVGTKRAVRAACDTLGSDDLRAAEPMLQPAALSRQTRVRAGHRRLARAHFAQLREDLAEITGTTNGELRDVYRVKPASVLMGIATLTAVSALLTQLSSPSVVWDTVSAAQPGWLIAAFLISMATAVPYAAGMMGSIPFRVPLWPAIELQIAMAFSNLAVPVMGGAPLQVRFLRKQGADMATAVASGGILDPVGSGIAQLALFVTAVLFAPNRLSLGAVSVLGIAETLVGVGAALGVAAGVVFGIRRLRHAVLPSLRQAVVNLARILRSPRQLALLLGGNAIAALLNGVCVFACLQALGTTVSLWTLLALNIGVGALASSVPAPGGNVAVATVGLSGTLVAIGVPEHIAVASVLINQLVVNYIPGVLGWIATRDLIQRDYL